MIQPGHRPGTGLPTAQARRRRAPPRRQDGVFAVMYAVLLMLMLMLAMMALAIDLSQVYNRKRELQALAEEVATAAARELDGSAAGVATARASAAHFAQQQVYEYVHPVPWDEGALTFSSSPDRNGAWVDAASAAASPQALYFAKVDTNALADAVGAVHTLFLPVLTSALADLHVAHSAVAGRTAVNVLPIAICAMQNSVASAWPSASAPNAELVQYGFRRGVSYDLMALNPSGVTPVRYLVHPASAPGTNGATFDFTRLGPFLCAGDMWTPRVTGGELRVSPLPASAPLGDWYRHLNVRFDDYTTADCQATGTPPDWNVMEYAYTQPGGASWMRPLTGKAAAASTTLRGRLETVADLPAVPSGTGPGDFGPLWINAKAVKYASWLKYGANEPATGYAPFSLSDWPTQYPASPTEQGKAQSPTAVGYPILNATPYRPPSRNTTYLAPASNHLELSLEERRILNVPLLACPVPSGQDVGATVLAVGMFLMTTRATPDTLVAEFGGVRSLANLSGKTELFP